MTVSWTWPGGADLDRLCKDEAEVSKRRGGRPRAQTAPVEAQVPRGPGGRPVGSRNIACACGTCRRCKWREAAARYQEKKRAGNVKKREVKSS